MKDFEGFILFIMWGLMLIYYKCFIEVLLGIKNGKIKFDKSLDVFLIV